MQSQITGTGEGEELTPFPLACPPLVSTKKTHFEGRKFCQVVSIARDHRISSSSREGGGGQRSKGLSNVPIIDNFETNYPVDLKSIMLANQ